MREGRMTPGRFSPGAAFLAQKAAKLHEDRPVGRVARSRAQRRHSQGRRLSVASAGNGGAGEALVAAYSLLAFLNSVAVCHQSERSFAQFYLSPQARCLEIARTLKGL